VPLQKTYCNWCQISRLDSKLASVQKYQYFREGSKYDPLLQ